MSHRRAHKLDPLLRPRSIAVVGASERPDSVGRRTMLSHAAWLRRLYELVTHAHRAVSDAELDCLGISSGSSCSVRNRSRVTRIA